MSQLPVILCSRSLFHGAPPDLQPLICHALKALTELNCPGWLTWALCPCTLLPISPDLSLHKAPGLCCPCTCAELRPGLINCFSREMLDPPCRKPCLVPWRDPGLDSSPCLAWGCQSLLAPCLVLWDCAWSVRVPPVLRSPLSTLLSSLILSSWLLYAMNSILQRAVIYSQCCTRSSQSWKDTKACICTKICEASDFKVIWLPQISSTQK